ncbi:hypothetical protein BRADI_2g27912v3 [Brachypodium distachyon]|uniref:Reverse transcriptase zinc-binding domain-containing protein n=1 Tax=Brachypodium distachyon TaxID=15368 RepID=A0A0Q3G5S4_BRADI|nr:hypothetical protein BRADI_2g27912v3 [Brachypodium distachyon]
MLLKRQFFLPNYTCVLCNQSHMETRDHLFFHFQFSCSCWRYICPDFTPRDNVHENLCSIKQELNAPSHMEISTLVTWSIWKARNDFIFNGITPSFYRCRRTFKEDLNLVFHRAKRKKYKRLHAWIERFR